MQSGLSWNFSAPRPNHWSPVIQRLSWGLVSAGERLADDGHIDLALRFLDAAATQANLADPGKPARAAVSAAVLRMPVRPDDARLLAILAFAEPEEHGPLIVERAAAIAAGPPLDPESAALLGASLNVVGAFDLSASFLAAAVAGLRDQGRLGRLPLVLTHQAWTAINVMDWSVAVPAAEESMRLAEDVGQPLWGVGAQTAVAMLAGLRGDYDDSRLRKPSSRIDRAADQSISNARRHPVDPRRRRPGHRPIRHRL